MTVLEKVERKVKEVMIRDVCLYAKEHGCSIDEANVAKKIHEDMRMTAIEMTEFLYPSKEKEQSSDDLIAEAFRDLEIYQKTTVCAD